MNRFEYLGVGLIIVGLYFLSGGECFVAVHKRHACFSDHCVQGVEFCNSLSMYRNCHSCSNLPDYCSYPNMSEQCLLVSCMENTIHGLEDKIQNLTAAMNNKDEEHKQKVTELEATIRQNELKNNNLEISTIKVTAAMNNKDEEHKQTVTELEEKLQTFQILSGVAITFLVVVVLLVLLVCLPTARRVCKKYCDAEVPDSPNINEYVPPPNTIIEVERNQSLVNDEPVRETVAEREQLLKSEVKGEFKELDAKMQTDAKQFYATVPTAPPVEHSPSTQRAATPSPGAPPAPSAQAAPAAPSVTPSVTYKNCNFINGNKNCQIPAPTVVKSPITNSSVGNMLPGPNQPGVPNQPEMIPAETGDLPRQTSEQRQLPMTHEERGQPVQDTEPPKNISYELFT